MMYTILISQPEKNFHVNLSSEYYWGSVRRRVEVVEAVLVVASDDKSINWCFCCFSVRKVNSWFTITWRSADPASLLLFASNWKMWKIYMDYYNAHRIQQPIPELQVLNFNVIWKKETNWVIMLLTGSNNQLWSYES